ncbi:MAG: periplasmic divalent cation tolerance protein [Candidatus Dependentiae bacterium]|nr:periplasmic divalent cation tolerance protein [Candidatus Dependentiae bacterium]
MSEPHKTTQIVLIYTTVSSREQAETIARAVVTEHLAACVNIMPGVTSFCSWNNAVAKEEEYLIILKTGIAQKTALLSWLDTHHPYTVPVLLSGSVEVNEKFAHFVQSALHTRKDLNAR